MHFLNFINSACIILNISKINTISKFKRNRSWRKKDEMWRGLKGFTSAVSKGKILWPSRAVHCSSGFVMFVVSSHCSLKLDQGPLFAVLRLLQTCASPSLQGEKRRDSLC